MYVADGESMRLSGKYVVVRVVLSFCGYYWLDHERGNARPDLSFLLVDSFLCRDCPVLVGSGDIRSNGGRSIAERRRGLDVH